ncbi:MAG: hypothetical protein ACE5ID_01855, partial [Acidobacteriota bacterium]
NPQVQVFPRNPDYSGHARGVENLINYDIEELNFKRQMNRALTHHLFAPFSWPWRFSSGGLFPSPVRC